MTDSVDPEFDESILPSQRDYYEARAPEYDDWFFRRGRYAHGEDAQATWWNEVDEVRAAVAEIGWRDRSVLELAPGTGLWTSWMIDQGARLHVIDNSGAMIMAMLVRLDERSARVQVTQADIFAWQPTTTYDRVFFSFWLSHVPRRELASFLAKVARALAPGGVVVLLDSLRNQTATAVDHVLPAEGDEIMTRRLDDGTEFQIVKNFWDPDELVTVAASVGLSLQVTATANYFYYGIGVRTR